MQHICKMDKLEIRAVIKNFCKKGMPERKFMKTAKESSSYSTVKRAAEFKRGRESVEDDGWSGRPKDATADKHVKVVHPLVMCDRRRDLRSIASEVGISIGAVLLILTDISGISKVSARWCREC